MQYYEIKEYYVKIKNDLKLCLANMSCDVNENNYTKKCKKKTWLSTFCTAIFGCAIKENSSDEKTDKIYISTAVQCQLINELGRFEDGRLFLESRAKFDVAVVNNEINLQTDEFTTSLNKLDNLINTLNEIQGIYKNKILTCNESILENSDTQNQITKHEIGDTETNNFQNKGKLENICAENEIISDSSEEEILKFNINFNEYNRIQCHTSRGKHSLKIIQNCSKKYYNPLILHRCESEMLLTKYIQDNICESKTLNRKSSPEICCQEGNHLQRSYHTLPGRFENVLNVSSFKSKVVQRMRNIKEDVKTLRNMLCNIEHLVKRNDIPIVPLYLKEIRKWFTKTDIEIMCSMDDYFLNGNAMNMEDSRYIKAKTRATHFCKFYTLTKQRKVKSKLNKLKKS